MAHPLNPLFRPSIVRLGPRPDDPQTIVGPRPRHSRRPHTDATVAAVRRLIEESVLTYSQIAAKTGVGRASICRWTRDQNWKRPLFAPRATDTVPRERASAQLRRRTLAARLAALAERYVRELEAAAEVDLDKLAEAFELMKMSKAAALGRRRRRKPSPPFVAAKAGTHKSHEQSSAVLDTRLRRNEREEHSLHEASPREVMRGLRAAGVRVERAPEDALTDFIASSAPKPERLTRKQRQHRWMLGRE